LFSSFLYVHVGTIICFVGVLPVCFEGECAGIELWGQECYHCNYIWKFMEMAVLLVYTLFLHLKF